MSTSPHNNPPLMPVEREYLTKERANLLDRLTFVEQKLGIPSSVMSKGERRAQRQEKEYTDGKSNRG